jgi:hypothetical protein
VVGGTDLDDRVAEDVVVDLDAEMVWEREKRRLRNEARNAAFVLDDHQML